ncbi:hypothetical protein [Modestobacter roseus]|uniref:Uncharacterized protein n=1 Tax=Modestobacter roseus TaxID=1181884 RepID=A0A562ILS6_9ACTN|nr:hypothetical protein [Modestobacter roseus]TWH71967.1 hypothetical protein JD78_00468 [Modestobacter roseus]
MSEAPDPDLPDTAMATGNDEGSPGEAPLAAEGQEVAAANGGGNDDGLDPQFTDR